MAKAFHLSIVTPEGGRFDGDVVSLTFPGEDGYIGVWANHAPMLSSMRPGIVSVRPAGDDTREDHYAVSMGFAEVSDNNAILLVDSCEDEGSIDLDRARAALERAKKLMATAMHDDSIDRGAAQLAIERAEARLKAGYLRG